MTVEGAYHIDSRSQRISDTSLAHEHKRYKDDSLDVVFLAASHTYEDVKADIQAWKPKVKQGGYLGGHDFQTEFPGVVKAVTEEISDCRYLGFSWITQIK